MKAYVVNLDSRPERLETFKENTFPFDITRVSAIKMDMVRSLNIQLYNNLTPHELQINVPDSG